MLGPYTRTTRPWTAQSFSERVFSFVTGLPLTRNLFDTGGVLPRSQSAAAETNHREVSRAYSNWLMSHPGTTNAEEWLLELYRQKDNALQEMAQRTTWSKALRLHLRA
jgi:hypothetical protein